MLRKFVATVAILGYLGSVNAQEETPPQNQGPVQSKKEAKGKKAVPERGEDPDVKGGVIVSSPPFSGNPMLTVGQKKMEKKAPPKPAAGEPEKKTRKGDPEHKNTAMMGLGYSTTLGIHLNVEVQKEDIRRTCQMNLPNLFFCIPGALREPEKKEEKTPIGINEAKKIPVKFLAPPEFRRSVEDLFEMAGTQYLGLVEVEENPFRR